MRWKFVALVGSVLAVLLCVAVPQSASALPGTPRGDVAGSQSANAVEKVHRRGWRHRHYRRYGYYDPYYYDGGYPYYYRRRPGFGIYLSF